MKKEPWDPNAIVEAMRRRAPDTMGDPELQKSVVEFMAENGATLGLLRIAFLTVAASFIETMDEVGQDREIVDRVLGHELQLVSAIVIRAMKQRQGKLLDPARFAFVAFATADDAINFFDPCNCANEDGDEILPGHSVGCPQYAREEPIGKDSTSAMEDAIRTARDVDIAAADRAEAVLDGMADLWFAESGFAKVNLPEPVVRMVKQAHAEGLYRGRCSAVDAAAIAANKEKNDGR